jgi:hypothetical protein
VNGRFEACFAKLSALHSKTQFSFAIVAGNLFADPDETTNEDVDHVTKLLDGHIQVPLPTYFALGTFTLPDKVIFKLKAADGEVCANLFFLGRRTTTKTTEAVRIVSLGGEFDPELKGVVKDPYSFSFSEDDAKSLKGAGHADILVTSEWPKDITKGSKVPLSQETPTTIAHVAELALALKPKYHFSTSGRLFYEREPFINPTGDENSDVVKITRFISLADFNNPDKQKWIYAFSIDPVAADPMSLPPGVTSCPLDFQKKKRPTAENSLRFSQDTGREAYRPRKRKRGPPPGASECFFCLSNSAVATHLITSIGNDSYVTTAKGPLTTDVTYPALGFPGHMLIIPLTHSPTVDLIPADSKESTIKEMGLFRSALNNMLRSKDPSLGSVTWEVSQATGVHIHWQWLPVSDSLVERGLVDAAFHVEAENLKYPKFESKLEDDVDFFRVLIWNSKSGKETSFVLPLDPSFRFEIQFGRRVLAKLLQLDSRADWRQCGQTEEDEKRDVENFKEAFKEFDFSLE